MLEPLGLSAIFRDDERGILTDSDVGHHERRELDHTLLFQAIGIDNKLEAGAPDCNNKLREAPLNERSEVRPVTFGKVLREMIRNACTIAVDRVIVRPNGQSDRIP